MMTRRLTFMISLLLLATLAGCGPNRAASDAKTVLGLLLLRLNQPTTAEDTIDVKSTHYLSEQSSEDTSLRTVKFHAYYVHNHGRHRGKKTIPALSRKYPGFRVSPRISYRLDRGGCENMAALTASLRGDLNDMFKINQAVEPILN